MIAQCCKPAIVYIIQYILREAITRKIHKKYCFTNEGSVLQTCHCLYFTIQCCKPAIFIFYNILTHLHSPGWCLATHSQVKIGRDGKLKMRDFYRVRKVLRDYHCVRKVCNREILISSGQDLQVRGLVRILAKMPGIAHTFEGYQTLCFWFNLNRSNANNRKLSPLCSASVTFTEAPLTVGWDGAAILTLQRIGESSLVWWT